MAAAQTSASGARERSVPEPPEIDFRIELVRLQSEGNLEGALEATLRIEGEQPERAHAAGVPYLRGHLLDQMGRPREAAEAFARSMATGDRLDSHARLRIAYDQLALGHPEVAAGLTATVLGSRPPQSLVDSASRLLARTLAEGGDCRLLRDLSGRGFATEARRRIQLMRADCSLRAGDARTATELLRQLLQESVTDLSAHQASERLEQLEKPPFDKELLELLGQTYYHHREFGRSSQLLERLVIEFPETLSSQAFRTYYDLARSNFWMGQFETAARRYGDMAERTQSTTERARSLYQQGRSLELAGDWQKAIDSYLRSLETRTTGDLSGSALIGAMRLHYRREEHAAAQQLYVRLGERKQWRYELSRAALFLAVSDLVRGHTERAEGFLDQADRASPAAALEVNYWRGRLAESQGRTADAVAYYGTVLRTDEFHPLALSARERLVAPALAAAARALGLELASSEALVDLHTAWLLLGGQDPRGARARLDLLRGLAADSRAARFLTVAPVAVEEWPLWQSELHQPEEQLLALGIWREAETVAMRYFPPSRPDLALTASRSLARAEAHRQALLIAEILLKRLPPSVPQRLLPSDYREQLFPLAYLDLVERAGLRYGVDPHLVASVIRQESHFEPKAVSAVAARGLTQFVLPTAYRLAPLAGLAPLEPADLENPEVSIALGSLYLRELLRRYEGREHVAVAAYNAGESQAELWQSHCYTAEPDEYFTKVTFQETRNYVAHVLAARAQYDDIYGQSNFGHRADLLSSR